MVRAGVSDGSFQPPSAMNEPSGCVTFIGLADRDVGRWVTGAGAFETWAGGGALDGSRAGGGSEPGRTTANPGTA